MKKIIAEIAIERGVPPVTLRKWKSRGAVPHKHRIAIMEAALKRGQRVKAKDFDFGRAA